MGTTQPIRNKDTIQKIKDYLCNKNYRDYLLFTVCVNTALRIGDVLNLKWEDLYDFDTRTVKKHIIITEQKTKKKNTIALNSSIIEAIGTYIAHKDIHRGNFVFQSRKGANRPISRYRAYVIFQNTANILRIEKFSCHSLRKTFGYHAWKLNVSSALLTEIYNHSSFSITKKYLGIVQDDKDSVYNMNIL